MDGCSRLLKFRLRDFLTWKVRAIELSTGFPETHKTMTQQPEHRFHFYGYHTCGCCRWLKEDRTSFMTMYECACVVLLHFEAPGGPRTCPL